MSERKTVEIVTPKDGHKLVLKDWLTGREYRSVNNALLKQMGDIPEGETQPKVTPEILNEHQDAKILAVVVSVNGTTDGVLDKVLDMSAQDYAFVVEEVNKRTDSLSETTKKK